MTDIFQNMREKKEAYEDLLDRMMRRQTAVAGLIKAYDAQGEKGEVAKYQIELNDIELIIESLQESIDRLDTELRKETGA
jgi:hypothetical protein